MLAERFNLNSHAFILPPSVFLLTLCFLLVATGCRTQTDTTQQQTQTTTQQQVSTQQPSPSQPSVVNANGTEVAQTVAAQNSNVTARGTTTTFDPCSLLTPSEIASVQGDEVKESRAAPGNSNRLAVSQCYFQTATPSKSVSLEVTRRIPGQRDALSPREFWEERFEGEEHERERERGRKGKREADKREAERRGARGSEEEEEEGGPPQRVAGVGDEAFWSGNRIVGALYVLKGDSIIRISVGGVADQSARLEKTKTLAQMALKRLKD
ncbi:MAG TPA: hypothetical protein VF553_03080 [Pyrinomonadaceae bacterium]|jgi:hypothetical protein